MSQPFLDSSGWGVQVREASRFDSAGSLNPGSGRGWQSAEIQVEEDVVLQVEQSARWPQGLVQRGDRGQGEGVATGADQHRSDGDVQTGQRAGLEEPGDRDASTFDEDASQAPCPKGLEYRRRREADPTVVRVVALRGVVW